MVQPEHLQFIVMTDENVARAVSRQLVNKGVNAVRLIDKLPESTPDPDVLEYCHQEGFILITMDKRIRQHVDKRIKEGKEHAGVFIAVESLQGNKGIGIIVNEIVFFHEAIRSGAASLEDEVYNQIRYIKPE